jgi:hypothetical protein
MLLREMSQSENGQLQKAGRFCRNFEHFFGPNVLEPNCIDVVSTRQEHQDFRDFAKCLENFKDSSIVQKVSSLVFGKFSFEFETLLWLKLVLVVVAKHQLRLNPSITYAEEQPWLNYLPPSIRIPPSDYITRFVSLSHCAPLPPLFLLTVTEHIPPEAQEAPLGLI